MTDPNASFSSAAKKADIQSLIALARESNSPREINDAMLAASSNPPFWPDHPDLTKFLIAAKSDPALDVKLLAAAALSAKDRADALLENRTPNKQGAFTNFIYVSEEAAFLSRVYKVIRAPQIGGGTGGWGGLKEDDDIDVSVTVNREIYEEVIDGVKMVLKIAALFDKSLNATDLEQDFDAALKDAGAQKKPLSEGVTAFINSLSHDPELQEKILDVSAPANELIDGLVAATKTPLFTCRDDAHAINRGWGFQVDAFAHVARIDKATAEKFDDLRRKLRVLKSLLKTFGKDEAAGEMEGIAVYNLVNAPLEITKNHYGHEGLAEIIGFALLLKQQNPETTSADYDLIWSQFEKKGAIAALAESMRLQPVHLRKMYDQCIAGSKDAYPAFSAEDYKEAATAPVAAASPKGPSR